MGKYTVFWVDSSYKPKSDADDACIVAVRNVEANSPEEARERSRGMFHVSDFPEAKGCSQNNGHWRHTSVIPE